MTGPLEPRSRGSRPAPRRPRTVAGRARASEPPPLVEPVETTAPPVERVETTAPPVEPVETTAPLVEPVETTAPLVEPVETTDLPVQPVGPVETRAPRFASRRTTATLLVLLLLLAVGAGGEWWWLRRDDPTTVAGEADDVTIAVPESRFGPAVEAAAQDAELVLSTAWRTYDTELDEATAQMTDEFATTFRGVAEDTRAEFLRRRTEVTVKVAAQGVVRASDNQVQVLLFLNQYTSHRGGPLTYSPYRALFTMVSTPDGWLVEQIDTQ